MMMIVVVVAVVAAEMYIDFVDSYNDCLKNLVVVEFVALVVVVVVE
jgi:hypothetical protein